MKTEDERRGRATRYAGLYRQYWDGNPEDQYEVEGFCVLRIVAVVLLGLTLAGLIALTVMWTFPSGGGL